MHLHTPGDATAYDYVIYSASVAGVLLALHKASAGHTVLVLNSYGFPGGSITESLSCLQQWPDGATAPHARALFGQLAADPYASVFNGPEGRVLNPEVIKFTLQHALEASSVALLFHVKARHLVPALDGLAALSVIGKEGEFAVRARTVVDASDAGHLARLAGGTGRVTGARLCVFTSPILAEADAEIRGLPGIQQAVRLPDGRYWLALDLPAAPPTTVETQANDLLDALTAALAPHEARLQIVPAETQLLYEPAAAAVAAQSSFYFIADLLPGRTYAPGQWLQRAADVEAAAAAVTR